MPSPSKKPEISGIIKLSGKEAAFKPGSARDSWWKVVQKWDKHRVRDWVDAMKTTPPSKPKSGLNKEKGEPPTGWLRFFQKEGLLTVEADDVINKRWSDHELRAALAAYEELATRIESGEKVSKKDYYNKLAREYGRSPNAYEYRFQNISSILESIGVNWIDGLRPAKNVGRKMSETILELIREEGFFRERIYAPTAKIDVYERRVKEIQARGLLAKPPGSSKPKKTMTTREEIARDPMIKAWVLQEANGTCECCQKSAPFRRKSDGAPYLEVHHIKLLANGGSDTVSNAVALCANCHREIHFGENSDERINSLFDQLPRLIREN